MIIPPIPLVLIITLVYAATQIKARANEVQKQIGAKKKAKEDASELLAQKIAIEKEHKEMLDSAAQKEVLMNKKLGTIGNIIHDSVPISKTEDDNPTLKEWAPEGMVIEKKTDVLSHHEVLLRLDGYNPEAGTKIVGHRGYFLQQWGFFLNQAIIKSVMPLVSV